MEDTAKGISRKQDVIDDWLAQISKSGEVVAEWTGQVVGNGRGGDGDFLDLAAMDALVVAIRDGTDREVVAELLLLEGEVLDGEICTGLQLQKETGGLSLAVLCHSPAIDIGDVSGALEEAVEIVGVNLALVLVSCEMKCPAQIKGDKGVVGTALGHIALVDGEHEDLVKVEVSCLEHTNHLEA